MKKIMALLFACILLFTSCAMAEKTVVLPEGYVQGEPLPIYRAIPRKEKEASFFDKADPTWFNQSGVAGYENASRRARYDFFTFNDEAQMNIDIGYIDYQEYDGVHYAIDGDAPDKPRGPFPRPSFSTEVSWMANDARLDIWSIKAPQVQLDHEELVHITLAQARKTVEEVLEKLNVTGYELSYALDMSAEKIRLLGQWEEERRKTFWNTYDRFYDFSQATAENEGYFLFYERKIDGARTDELDGDISLEAYVDADGLVRFTLRDPYSLGELYEMPENLLTSDEIFDCFIKDNPRREKDGFMQPEAISAELMYAPMRAPDKKDGMVFSPMWYVTYTFLDVSPCDGWVWYSAVDGRLVADCYS